MNPVIKPSTIERLKTIIDSAGMHENNEGNAFSMVDEIEEELKGYDDNRENKIFLFGSSALILILAGVLIYVNKASWPLMFVFVWIGAFLYYRVTEKSLIIESLQKRSLISPSDPIPKMEYILSGIDLKIGRKTVLKGFLSLVLSSSVMLAHHLFVDSSVTINMFLLISAIIASYLFWNSFYKEDIKMLNDLKIDVNQLKSKTLLSRYNNEEE